MRIIFMGTPAFAAAVLEDLLNRRREVVAVYTRAPKPAGRRGLAMTRSAVHELALVHGLPVATPATLRDTQTLEAFRAHAADVAVVAAYGLILPEPILDAPRCGCLNLHASLLPRWRGAAPIHRAVMAGDAETGVTAMRMDVGLDTGPIGPAAKIAIGANDTTGLVHDKLAALAGPLADLALDALHTDRDSFRPQPECGVLYAPKIDKSECRIDWRRPSGAVHNQIRGLSPFPGAFFEADFGRGAERVKALESRLVDAGGAPGEFVGSGMTVACGAGAVALVSVQPAGKERMSADAFLRGRRRPAFAAAHAAI